MTKTLQSILLATSIALTGALFTGPAFAGAAEDAIADAKEALKQADSVGGAWRDTGKMIKKAEELLKQDKIEEAEKLAREAEAQAMNGYIQATSQPANKLHI